jgi:fructose-specific phosphotransferase system IIC component
MSARFILPFLAGFLAGGVLTFLVRAPLASTARWMADNLRVRHVPQHRKNPWH